MHEDPPDAARPKRGAYASAEVAANANGKPQSICFFKRELGKCSKPKCPHKHIENPPECTDSTYVATGICPNYKRCECRHPASKGKVTLFGNEPHKNVSAMMAEEKRVSKRDNKGIPAQRYLDETDCDHLILLGVPEGEMYAALQDSNLSSIHSSEQSTDDSLVTCAESLWGGTGDSTGDPPELQEESTDGSWIATDATATSEELEQEGVTSSSPSSGVDSCAGDQAITRLEELISGIVGVQNATPEKKER